MSDNAAIAADLEALLQGTLSEATFRDKHESRVATSPLLDCSWGNLDHYLGDADIRARNPEYRSLQEGPLRKLIALLKNKASLDELGRITFLSRG